MGNGSNQNYSDNIASAEGRRSRAARHSAVYSTNVTPVAPSRTRRRTSNESSNFHHKL